MTPEEALHIIDGKLRDAVEHRHIRPAIAWMLVDDAVSICARAVEGVEARRHIDNRLRSDPWDFFAWAERQGQERDDYAATAEFD